MDRTSKQITSLVRALVLHLPSCSPTADPGAPFLDLAGEVATDTVAELLSGPALTGSGVAVAAIIDRTRDPETRRRLFVLASSHQRAQYPGPKDMASWSDEEWDLRLDALLEAEDVSIPALDKIVAETPTLLVEKVIAVGATYGAREDEELRAVVVDRLRDRVAELADGEAGQIAALFPWPAPGDEPALTYAVQLLSEALEPTVRVPAVAAALAGGRVQPVLAPLLLADGQTTWLLDRPEMTPALVRAVVSAAYYARPEETEHVVREAQARRFSLDIAAGAAAHSAGAAFNGAAGGYDGLNDAQRTELLDLVELYGSWEQEEVIGRFATDTLPAGRVRRARALTLVGRLAPKGG